MQEGGAPASYTIPGNRTYTVWIGDLAPEATDEEIIEAYDGLNLDLVQVGVGLARLYACERR